MRDLQQSGFWLIEILTNYGRALAQIGRSDEARKNLDDALAQARSLKNDAKIASALSAQGDSFFYQGDYKSAAPLYAQALQAAARTTDRELLLLMKVNLAKLAIKQGGSQSATATLRKLSDEADALGSNYVSVQCSVFLGEALFETKNYAKAQQVLQLALDRSDKLGLRSLLAQSHYLLGRVIQQSGKSNDAASQFAEAHRIAEEIEKEAGGDSISKRSDLAPLFADPGK